MPIKTNIKITFSCILLIGGIMSVQFVQAQEKKSVGEQNSFKKYSLSRSSGSEAAKLLSSAESIKEKNPSKAIDLIQQSLVLSIKEGDKATEAKCYTVLGNINLKSNLYELAIKNYSKAIQLYTEQNDEASAAEARTYLAESYDKSGDANEALRLYQEQLTIYKKYLNEKQQMNIRYRIADLQAKTGKIKVAQKSYEEILNREQSSGNKEGTVEANKKLGELYEKQDQNKQALQYYNRAQTIAEDANDVKSYNQVNENISSVLKKEGKHDEEIALRKRGLAINKDKNDEEAESIENLALAKAYLDAKQPEQAIPYLKRSIELTDRTGQVEQKAEAFQKLSDAYSQKKQYHQAVSTYQKYITLKDSIIKRKEIDLSRALSANLSIADKQKQIELLEKDIQLNEKKIEALTSERKAREERLARQRVIIYSLLLGILVVAIASYWVYKNARKRRIANQLLALKSLRSQMNPHFIFNALNSVNSFISKNDEKSANKYLSDFSRLMRMVMENSQHDFVPLSSELSILELYIGLEHFRFKEKFDFNFTVDDKIDREAYEVPPMLIQPYIENAVWHGLRYKESKGFLLISFHHQDDGQLKIIIEDNGIGRKKSEALKTINQKANNSTGIKNTVNSVSIINELYQKNIRIQIDDAVPQNEDSGTRVEILLPAKITKIPT